MTEHADDFSASTNARLDALIAASPPGSVAVFDADGTLWADDIGESFFEWLIEGRRLLGVDYSRDIFADYVALCERDKAVGYGSIGPIMAGIEEETLNRWCADYFAAHFEARIFKAQAALVDRLHGAGWQVWIVSASPRWIVAAGGVRLGIPAARSLGVDVVVEGGVLTDRLIEPVPCGPGKAALIEARVGVRPTLASGNAMTDLEMMLMATGLTLAINPSEALREEATRRGWAVEHCRGPSSLVE